MVQLNLDIIERISDFLPENPVIYCRLAMVNRDFHRVFTTNRRWARLNPYQTKSSIFRTFVNKTTKFDAIVRLIKFAWSDQAVRWSPKVIVRISTNRYVWLGLMRKTQHHLGDFKDMPHLLEATLRLNPAQWENFPPSLHRDFKFSMMAAKLYQEVVPQNFPPDQREQLINVRIRNPFKAIDDTFLPFDQITRDMYDIAIKANPLNYSINIEWGSKYLHDKFIFQTLMLSPPLGFHEDLAFWPQHADDKVFVLELLKPSGKGIDDLKDLSDRLCDDKEVVLAAIKRNPCHYEGASQRLRTDPEVMLATVRSELFVPMLYSSFPAEHMTDDIALEIAKRHPTSVMRLDRKFRTNKMIARRLLKDYPMAINEVKDALSPFEAQRTIIRYHPHTIMEMAKSEPEYDNLVNMAISVNANLLFDITGAKSDIDLIRVALKSNATIFARLDFEFRRHPELVLLAAKYWPSEESRAPVELLSSREAVAIMASNGTIIPEEIPHAFRDDLAMVKEAVSRHGTFDRALLSKRELALEAVKAKRHCIRHIPFDRDKSTDLMRDAVAQNGALFAELSTRYLRRPEVYGAIGPLNLQEDSDLEEHEEPEAIFNWI